MMNQENNTPASGLFAYLLLLTTTFIFFEISFLIQRSGFYFADAKFMTAHLTIPWLVVPGILFFLFAQLLVHFLFTSVIWAVARLASVTLRLSWQRTQQLGFSLWGLGVITVLLANRCYFPNSAFSGLIDMLMSARVAWILFVIFALLCLVMMIFAVVGLLLTMQRRMMFYVSMVLAVVMVGAVFLPAKPIAITNAGTAEKPNIILIGVDSLRPDAIGYFGGKTKRSPHMDAFLQHATVFTQAVTPIARTFPAWVSIFTGQYPKNNGMRFDLEDQTHFNARDSLPLILQAHGYETLYAMDETRFSNITPKFGFDRLVTPPGGLNDFLLGSANDFPFSNLIVNSMLGKWLFPYSYANRPVFITYDPDSFLKLLQPALASPRTKPLFLAVHLCLPHAPYLWAQHAVLGRALKSVNFYKASVHRVDQQVNDLLTLLQRNGLLEHSVVVLLSDHGEALGMYGDRITTSKGFVAGAGNTKKSIKRFYPPTDEQEQLNQSAGHGTDVLSMTQYRPLLAFRFYGLSANQDKKVAAVVSLLDIKPTLLALLNIPDARADGHSLLAYIVGKKTAVAKQQDLFLESDFSPQSVHSVHPETRKVIFEGIDFFRIDPLTAYFTVKPSMGSVIISSKQRADLYGDWILALYPQQHGKTIPVLVNRKTGQWTDDLRTPFAKQSPAQHMLAALRQFYGNEITAVQND